MRRRKKQQKKKFRPVRYAPTPVLGAADRHMVSRFSYGTTPELVREVQAAGGGLAWFEQQLATADADAAIGDWWPDLHRDAATLWEAAAGRGPRGLGGDVGLLLPADGAPDDLPAPGAGAE